MKHHFNRECYAESCIKTLTAEQCKDKEFCLIVSTQFQGHSHSMGGTCEPWPHVFAKNFIAPYTILSANLVHTSL